MTQTMLVADTCILRALSLPRGARTRPSGGLHESTVAGRHAISGTARRWLFRLAVRARLSTLPRRDGRFANIYQKEVNNE
jgi:hypothetical protein